MLLTNHYFFYCYLIWLNFDSQCALCLPFRYCSSRACLGSLFAMESCLIFDTAWTSMAMLKICPKKSPDLTVQDYTGYHLQVSSGNKHFSSSCRPWWICNVKSHCNFLTLRCQPQGEREKCLLFDLVGPQFCFVLFFVLNNPYYLFLTIYLPFTVYYFLHLHSST